MIISEASLSFLGFGLSPEIPSWGTLLSRDGRKHMEQAPWLALWPGLCLTLTVYSLNMFGDALRDLLDPRLRGGGGRLGTHRGRVPRPKPSRSRSRRRTIALGEPVEGRSERAASVVRGRAETRR